MKYFKVIVIKSRSEYLYRLSEGDDVEYYDGEGWSYSWCKTVSDLYHRYMVDSSRVIPISQEEAERYLMMEELNR